MSYSAQPLAQSASKTMAQSYGSYPISSTPPRPSMGPPTPFHQQHHHHHQQQHTTGQLVVGLSSDAPPSSTSGAQAVGNSSSALIAHTPGKISTTQSSTSQVQRSAPASAPVASSAAIASSSVLQRLTSQASMLALNSSSNAAQASHTPPTRQELRSRLKWNVGALLLLWGGVTPDWILTLCDEAFSLLDDASPALASTFSWCRLAALILLSLNILEASLQLYSGQTAGSNAAPSNLSPSKPSFAQPPGRPTSGASPYATAASDQPSSSATRNKSTTPHALSKGSPLRASIDAARRVSASGRDLNPDLSYQSSSPASLGSSRHPSNTFSADRSDLTARRQSQYGSLGIHGSGNRTSSPSASRDVSGTMAAFRARRSHNSSSWRDESFDPDESTDKLEVERALLALRRSASSSVPPPQASADQRSTNLTSSTVSTQQQPGQATPNFNLSSRDASFVTPAFKTPGPATFR